MNLQNKEKAFGENNREYAYRVLRQNIMHLNLTPGESINEGEISDILEISRTPIREAIFRLRDELLIDVYSQSKSCVSLIDFLLVLEGHFIRIAVEPQVYKCLCGKLTDRNTQVIEENLQIQKYIAEGSQPQHRFFELDNEFHRLLYVSANKHMTWNMLQKACTHLDRLRILNDNFGETRIKPYYMEHKELLDSLIMGKSDIIENLAISHINSYSKSDDKRSFLFFQDVFSKYGEYIKNIPQDISNSIEYMK